MDITTRNFFRLLRAGAFGETEQIEPMSAWKWHRVYQLSVVHEVTALLFDGVNHCRDQFFLQMPEPLMLQWQKATIDIENANRQAHEHLVELFGIYSCMQLRPMLLKGHCMGSLYDLPLHRSADAVSLFFPFDTQGRKADQWARDNSSTSSWEEGQQLRYIWKDVEVVNHHKAGRLTNSLLNHTG